MADRPVRRALRWLFGDEGTVALETELQIVIAATAVSVAGIFVVSPIVAALADPFAVSPAEAGQLITAFTAPSILLVPVAGMLADRVGRKPVLVGGLVVFGIAGAAVGLTTSFAAALVLRGVQGIGYAAIIPVGVTIIGDLYAGSREATAQGLRVAGIQSVSLISPPLAGVLVLATWRIPFLLYLLALGVAAWAWVALPSVAPGEARSLRGYGADLVASLRRPVMAAIMLSFTARFLLMFAVFAYVSVLLSSTLGGSAVASGLVVAAYSVVSLSTSTQAGRLTASRSAVLVTLAGFLLLGAGIAVMGLGRSYPAVGLGVALLGLGSGVTGPVQKSLVTQLAPPSLRAGAVSSAVILQSVGQTAGPLLMGLLVARYAPADAFVAFGLVGGVAGALLMGVAYWSRAESPSPDDAPAET